MSVEKLRVEYQDNSGRAERLREAIVVQILELLKSADVTLGVPLESRVKDWGAIEEKLSRKSIELTHITGLHDLIGARVILLFRSDLDRVVALIKEQFEVISIEDTGGRLGEAEFGYQSLHLVVRLPKSWLTLPSLANLGDFVVELQVRTLAQHIWAAASHKLQYKQELGVPIPLRRTINRVSALLETVDLEFDRVLDERRNYVATAKEDPPANEPLNVETLAALLTDLLPAQNKRDAETYADLLADLNELNVKSRKQLSEMIERHLPAAIARDRVLVEEKLRDKDFDQLSKVGERVRKGVFFAHVGLVREILRQEFGKEVNDIFKRRIKLSEESLATLKMLGAKKVAAKKVPAKKAPAKKAPA